MQKLKKNWILLLYMTWGIWWILMRAVASLKICTLMCYFCRKYIMFELKKYRGIRVITLKNNPKFEEQLTCALKNDMSNLVNLDPTPKSFKICSLIGSFWPNYIMFKLRNYRGVMCHDTKALRKKCPYLELIWSVFSRIWTEYQKIRSIQSKSGKYGPE